ncbi:NrfD/PsrC family molybdoenzyme membrane anchor subunit [Halobiforma nitratireducens]|uniref:Polysulfide reductase NrfD n=1 Tax=Halobiforma nitratireducens JCM 10879 TaxID=1227454 RepID=M0MLN4_9EURY|nr:NrfD/PsrC family molybdoenzyme membrane anchor subunit [Halobiforma nitratireducens]EMA46592.1 polysulfide reductase NrfD [Halobiforma nitratireducens JCM 10879]
MSQSTHSSGLPDIEDGGKRLYAWLAAIAIGLVIGLYGVVTLFLEGTIATGIDSQAPWGILISTYVFFALLSTGICIGVVALAGVFGLKKYEPLVKRGVLLAIATLAAGLLVIFVSLGHQQGMIHLLLSANPGSPMWWMIVFYTIYMVALLAEFYLLERNGASKLSVSLLALLAPIAAGTTLGAIFGTSIRPYYADVFGPVYLVLTAVLSGVALIAAVVIVESKLAGGTLEDARQELVTETLGKYLGLLLGITIVTVAWKYIMGLTATNNAMAAAHEYMLFGPPSWWVWTFGIVLGLVVPFALVATSRTRSVNGVLAASVLVLVGMFASRLEYVLGGQVVSLTQDPSLQWPFVSYSPTGIEIAVVILGIAVFALLYTAGRLLFDLDEVPDHDVKTPSTPSPAVTGGDDDD